MVTYRTTITERIGDYESTSDVVYTLGENESHLAKLHELAREARDSKIENYDEYMNAYWFGDGITFVPAEGELIDEVREFLLDASENYASYSLAKLKEGLTNALTLLEAKSVESVKSKEV